MAISTQCCFSACLNVMSSQCCFSFFQKPTLWLWSQSCFTCSLYIGVQLHPLMTQSDYRPSLLRPPGGSLQVVYMYEGILRHKFNLRSNTPWHWVRPPQRLSFLTTSLCSFSNLRNDRTIKIYYSLCLHQETAIKKPLIATNNAQNSTKLHQKYK